MSCDTIFVFHIISCSYFVLFSKYMYAFFNFLVTSIRKDVMFSPSHAIAFKNDYDRIWNGGQIE